MSLAEVQCHLDKEGASNLVIDLIMNASSDRVFHESILLAIALLEGGNTTIQVGRRAVAGAQAAPGLVCETQLMLRASDSVVLESEFCRTLALVRQVIIQTWFQNMS